MALLLSSDVLDVLRVLDVSPQVRRLLCSPSRHKLLVLVGQCVEDSGDIVLQQGRFSVSDFTHILAGDEVKTPPEHQIQTTLVSLESTCEHANMLADVNVLADCRKSQWNQTLSARNS